MKMREEIDALSTMGLDPVEVSDFPAHHCPRPGASDPGLHRFDVRSLWRRAGGVVLWRDEPGDLHRATS